MESVNIVDVISDLISKEILPKRCEYKQLSGGTQSMVWAILCDGQARYVLKAGNPHVLRAEVHYLQMYRSLSFLPRLHHVDAGGCFIVYEYTSGETKYPGKNKRELLITLVQNIVSQYQQVPSTDKWGWLDAPHSSWRDFLIHRVQEKRATINDHLSHDDHQFILDIATRKTAERPYLLHGDFGAHNFLFENEQLVGVIDPFPVIGEPIYDLVYAFCSTPDDLDLETIAPAVAVLPTWQSNKQTDLHQEVLLGLYLRIATCMCHHPTDLPQYLEAWQRLRS
jgi:aminoglycoside phosphotransferase (APT) family kinase protein